MSMEVRKGKWEMRNENVNNIIMASYIKNFLKQLPFYGKNIKPRIRKFTNAKLLSELPFFKKSIKVKIKQLTTKKLLQEQLFYKQSINGDFNISRNERGLRGYAEAYKVEIIDNRNLSDSLSVSKNSIKKLFDKLLREKRGFKYIISVKTTLKKRINDNEIDLRPVYLNSSAKTVINWGYYLNESFEEILNKLDIRINEGSGWLIDKVEGLYINVANYGPLLGGSYIPLPKVINNSMKGLINLVNKDHK